MLKGLTEDDVRYLKSELEDFEAEYRILCKSVEEFHRPEDQFSTHELLDRTYLATDSIANTLLGHPSILGHKDATRLIFLAQACLYRAYETIANKELSETD